MTDTQKAFLIQLAFLRLASAFEADASFADSYKELEGISSEETSEWIRGLVNEVDHNASKDFNLGGDMFVGETEVRLWLTKWNGVM